MRGPSAAKGRCARAVSHAEQCLRTAWRLALAQAFLADGCRNGEAVPSRPPALSHDYLAPCASSFK
eukprot:2643716-Pyramimonas_sp.AAC.1